MKVIDFQDANCRHCYKCVRNCSVKAISVRNEQAHIIREACIHCGHCLEVCPQNAKTFASDMERVKGYLRQGMKTVISMLHLILECWSIKIRDRLWMHC